MPALWSHLKRVADPVLQRTAGMLVLPGKICTSIMHAAMSKDIYAPSKVSQHLFELEDECNDLPMLQMQNLH